MSGHTLIGMLKIARLRDRIPAVAELHRFILCTRDVSDAKISRSADADECANICA